MSSRATLIVLAGLSACTLDPLNAAVFQGSNRGRALVLDGYTTAAGATVRLEILDPPEQDPRSPTARWRSVTEVRAATTPSRINGEDLHAWSIRATPVSAAQPGGWPEGGLARFRLVQLSGTRADVLYTFDDADCIARNSAQPPSVIADRCKSHDNGILTLVDSDPLPSPSPPPRPDGVTDAFLSLRATPSAAGAYYAAIDAPPTLASFVSRYGFIPSDPTATYFNAGDLGLVRELHCRRADLSPQAQRIACYVSNHAADRAQIDAALDRPVVPAAPGVATVAMVWRSDTFTRPDGTAGPRTRRVDFIAYGPDGRLLSDLALDNEGPKAIPGLCLACHAGTYDTPSNTVRDAQFLPLDPDNFEYSSRVGFRKNDGAQQERLRQLNALVRQTSPTPAIAQLIDGWYARGGVNTAGTRADTTFVPPGWAAKPTVYSAVIGPFCRGCHVAQATTTLDTWAQLQARSGVTRAFVCDSRTMPHAEVTQARFWRSGARAHLAGALRWADPCAAD